jgi:hypothetical protein
MAARTTNKSDVLSAAAASDSSDNDDKTTYVKPEEDVLDTPQATAEEVAGDPKKPLSELEPDHADPVAAATAAARKKARAGSSTTPIAGESVVMGADGRGVPIAASSAPNPTTSSEIQESSAGAMLRATENDSITDHDGNELSGDVFSDRYPGSSVVYTTQRVYQTTNMPHSTRPTSVLVYAAGVAVPRGEAEAFKSRMSVSK